MVTIIVRFVELLTGNNDELKEDEIETGAAIFNVLIVHEVVNPLVLPTEVMELVEIL